MTDGRASRQAVVLETADGSYYALPKELIEQFRLPAEAQEELKRALEEQWAIDTQGYAGPTAASGGKLSGLTLSNLTPIAIRTEYRTLQNFFDEHYFLRTNPLGPDPAPRP